MIFRIFRQLPAKLSLGSLDFSGLWKDTVEMESTRLRELTHLCPNAYITSLASRKGEYPIKGIDTCLMLVKPHMKDQFARLRKESVV